MNLEEIWKWLKGKRNTFFAEAATAFILIAVLGVAGITAGRSGITKSSEVESVRTKAEANKVEEQEQENAEKKQETQTEEVIADGQYPIMGQSSVTTEQMVSYFQSSGKAYPAESLAKGGADSIETFCRIYVEEAQAEGVRPEVAFVQTMKETGFLQYGGDAWIEQFNFAGIGALDGNSQGQSASFPDVRTGIRAQIQHLKAYGSAEPLKNVCVDPRFGYVTRNSAPYVEWLGIKENPNGTGWASDAKYGYAIVNMINVLKSK